MMAALGLAGGAVRVCNSNEIKSWRTIIGSLMVAMFAGGLSGMILHDTISDPIYLGAVCSMGGYMGQITLVVIEKRVKKVLSIG